MQIAAYVEAAMKKPAVFEWHKMFKGRKDMKDDGRFGHSKTH